MLVGIQGSGKTTYANVMSKDLNIPIISSDGIRDEIKDIEEKDVFPLVYKRCADLIKENKDFIYDATNITRVVRKRLWDKMAEYGLFEFDVEAHYFVPDKALSTERIERRNKDPKERFFPIKVLDSYVENFETPEEDEGFTKIVRIEHYVHESK